MKYKRSLRRHHYDRKKLKVANCHYFGHSKLTWDLELNLKLGLYANTPKAWSCSCCSSPRKNKNLKLKDRLSVQEKISDIRLKEFTTDN
ncbi:hypothetical protein [Shewanella sp. TC10]|uniref:hypothetical protein n=1 Tax=Shewanella sp. TC10 TaxID=1419739 RepID=UPI00129EC0E6|nr:hypothetical protein [Shewanella sp. TC10]